MTHAGNSRSDVLPFLPDTASTYLDVGCSDGKFAELLRARRPGIVVDGVEPDEAVAGEGRRHFRDHFVGAFPDAVRDARGTYDCFTFLDCLEHMVEPWTALEAAKGMLAREGFVVASIPNARHVRVLRTVVLGRDWPWEDENVFDRTHLRWFTHKSIQRMFADAGFDVLLLAPINEWRNPTTRLAQLVLGSDVAATQFVVVARPRHQSER